MDRNSLLATFRIAIDREEEAARFYKELVEKADDPEVKKLFQQFAFDETSHRESLKGLYRDLGETVSPGD